MKFNSDRQQKRNILILICFFTLMTTLSARPVFQELNTLTEESVHLGKLEHYPALVVIVPQHDRLNPAIDLYHKLNQNFGSRTYLLISPDLPFYITQGMIRHTLEQEIEETAKSKVLLDWDRDTAQALFADNIEQPVVFLLEEDGTLLGRYHFEIVSEAFEFITATFSTVLSLNPDPLWAQSSSGTSSLAEETP